MTDIYEAPVGAGGAATRAQGMSFEGDNPSHSPAKSRLQVNFGVARRRLLISRLHRLGPAPLFHLLTDLDTGKPVWPTVDKYAALPADFIKAYGGDKFPAPFAIDGWRR